MTSLKPGTVGEAGWHQIPTDKWHGQRTRTGIQVQGDPERPLSCAAACHLEANQALRAKDACGGDVHLTPETFLGGVAFGGGGE